jgi:hypothetical protein
VETITSPARDGETQPTGGTRINLGAGGSPLDGWLNVDQVAGPGIDLRVDLDRRPSRLRDHIRLNHLAPVTEIVGNDFIEHIRNPLGLMQVLWDVAAPGCIATFGLPYGSHDDAWEDPTHVRPYFPNSWGYFSQPFYWRATYMAEENVEFTADWQLTDLLLYLDPSLTGADEDTIHHAVVHGRNYVVRQEARLVAVKPRRARKAELQVRPTIRFVETS